MSSNLSTDPQPVGATVGAQPVTNPNTANATLGVTTRPNFGTQPAPLPMSPTPLQRVSAPKAVASAGRRK